MPSNDAINMNIVTSHDYPPIPNRNADWSAIDLDTYDGAEGSNCPVGRGRTERDAINNLVEQLFERAAAATARVRRVPVVGMDPGKPDGDVTVYAHGYRAGDAFHITEFEEVRPVGGGPKMACPAEGQKIVPHEPTEAMVRACSTVLDPYAAQLVWKRMYHAAPGQESGVERVPEVKL